MQLSRILIATANQNKVEEISSLLCDLKIKVLSINDLSDYPNVIEDQDTLEGNAIKKAKEFFKATHIPSLADDTGLEVDALNGAPGVYSARFAGEKASYDDNVSKLLDKMKDVPFAQRTAQFKTVMAFSFGEKVLTAAGVCKGYISKERHGDGGFGYDPVFYIPDFQQTFAEMESKEKNKISHRGLALSKMKKILEEFGA